ncbi:hypothetical protein [Leptolyngbya sp. FACHB-8]|uniref:hypothetical protein n=1 Tax=unclassified Leptolyngbya TaxID=2650499 RepID=UPI0016871B12|nr:hypothetical protein [Leptolyngbya sp. FACHB-8]MBD1914053.1 hypothetical protein [Leptolyngbya sp. FACHB-8]
MIPPALANAEESCPISQSIYRDGNGQGFELVFGPPPVGSIVDATAVINHPLQSHLYEFTVDQVSGYGSIWMAEQVPTLPNGDQRFWLAFFDQNLRSATPPFFGEETEAPKYAVISELGSHDYYARRGTVGQTEVPLLQDVIWIHERCQ